MIYYYGEPDQEQYGITDLEEAIRDVWDCMMENDEYAIVIELKVSRKSGERFCKHENAFTGNHKCGKWCDNYEPRNGKNGICTHQSWGLIETGRKWKVFLDGSYKKISGRKK